MDIARTPSTPDGNPEMADAPPASPDRPGEPTLIRREDYAPFPWKVPTTRLEFALGVDATRVTATLAVERNPDAAPADTIPSTATGLRRCRSKSTAWRPIRGGSKAAT